jgi:hypothetical protein
MRQKLQENRAKRYKKAVVKRQNWYFTKACA